MDLPEAVRVMNDIEYLKSQRMTEQEMLMFRQQFGLDDVVQSPVLTPAEWLEIHAHHAEFEVARH